MILPGFTNSSPVPVLVDTNASQSTVALSPVYQQHLSPLFNCFGHYVCEVALSIPTQHGFYTSKVSLNCLHAPRDAEVILESDWISTCLVAFCNDGSRLEVSIPVGVTQLFN
jgi:hypothetical protein